MEELKRLRQYVHAVKEIQCKELSGQPHKNIRLLLKQRAYVRLGGQIINFIVILAKYNLCVDFLREIDKELGKK